MTNPNLHADFTGLGVGSDIAVIDIGLQSVKGNTAFLILFLTGKFSTAETSGAVDLDTVGTVVHSKLDSTLHRTAETDTTLKLLSNALSHQLSIGLSAADFNDVKKQLFALSQFGEFGTELIKHFTFGSDKVAGTGRVNGNAHATGEALDLNACNSSSRMHLADASTDLKILLQPVTEQSTSGVFLVGEPA